MSEGKDRIRKFLREITVEPVLFTYMLAVFLQYPSSQALTYQKVCLLKYNDSKLCDELNHNSSLRTEEKYIQSVTSIWILYETVSLTVPSILMTSFIGSWGDKFNRKIPLVFPCIGGVLSSLSLLVNSIFIKAPLPLLLIGPLLNSLTGGFVALMMATFSYVSSVTNTRSRTFRMGVLEAMTYIAGTLGVVALGTFLDSTQFIVVFSVITSLFLIALMYVVIFVRRVQSDEALDGTTANGVSQYLSCFGHAVQSVRSVFRQRQGKTRLHIWLLISTVAFLMVCTTGLTDILLLFVRHSPLSWKYSLYGYLQGLHNGLRSLLLLIVLPVLKKLGAHDTTLILGGLVSKVGGLVLLGFSTRTWMVFLFPVLSMLEGFPSAGCRSLLSTMVGRNEQGKMFGAVASVESVMTVLASLIFNSVYSATQGYFPGLSFLVMAGLSSLPIGFIILLKFHLRNQPLYSILSEPVMNHDEFSANSVQAT